MGWLKPGMFFMYSMTLAAGVWAGVEAGPGVAFLHEQTYVRDAQGYYFMTQEQQLVGTCAVRYTEGAWTGSLLAAWADWNVGGEWTGSHVDATAMDPFFWGRRQSWELRGAYEFWHGLAGGLGYSDRAFRHYRGDDLFVYLQTRTRTVDVFLRYAFLRMHGFELSATGTWSPYAYLELYQNTTLPDWYPAVHAFDASGKGTQWRAALQASYRHPWGWGVDLIYDAGFARFPEPSGIEECSQRFGHLGAYVVLPF